MPTELSPDTFTGAIINNAYRLAGAVRKGQPVAPAQISDGIFYLNNILASWGENDKYIFYYSDLRFVGQTDKLFYKVGTAATNDVIDNPIASIDSITYDQGNVTYRMTYLTYADFMVITYKNINSFPDYYTYQEEKNYTRIGIYPLASPAYLFNVRCKKKLLAVNLFSELDEVPRYAFNPLMYELANIVKDVENSTPAAGFSTNYMMFKAQVTVNNKIDLSSEIDFPFIPCNRSSQYRTY